MSPSTTKSGMEIDSSLYTPSRLNTQALRTDDEKLVTVSRKRLYLESKRPQWLREMFAEFFGVFLYAFPGIAATATLVFAQLAQYTSQLTSSAATFQAEVAGQMTELAVTAGAPASNIAALQKDAAAKGLAAVLAAAGKSNAAATGSFLTVGFSFGLGITFAIMTAAHVSGGHFSPALTLNAVIFDKFSPLKALRYFVAQLLGGLMAALLVYGIFHQQFVDYKAGALGSTPELRHALIRIFCSIPDAKQGIGYMFLAEFVVCFFMGLIMMACMDASNSFVSRPVAALSIGMTYALSIWAFGTLNIGLNTAKDFSARIVASMAIGPEAFTYRSASWVGTLVNIPAVLVAKVAYDVIFKDTKRQVRLGLAKLEEPAQQSFEYSTSSDHKESV